MKKLLAASALAFGLLASAAHAQLVPVTEHYAVFAKYVKAVNAHDIEALRALIADDVTSPRYRGCVAAMSNRDCLAFYVDTTVMKQHGNIVATDSFGVDGDTMYAGLILTSDTIRNAGVDRAQGMDKITVKNGKITALQFLPNMGDAQTKKWYDIIRTVPPQDAKAYVTKR
jgi:ketosteroid isomerase-like protein